MKKTLFCYQCQETTKGSGCTVTGVCGKDDVTGAYQDALIYLLKGLAAKNISANKEDQADVGLLVAESLFMTLTNVNFDKAAIWDRITEVTRLRDAIKTDNCPAHDSCTVIFKNEEDILKLTNSLKSINQLNIRRCEETIEITATNAADIMCALGQYLS